MHATQNQHLIASEEANQATEKLTLPSFMQLLALADAISIDDGAIPTDWTTSQWTDMPPNEVVRFVWTDGEYEYSEVLTEEGVTSGVFDDSGQFIVTNKEGHDIRIKLFRLEALGLDALSA